MGEKKGTHVLATDEHGPSANELVNFAQEKRQDLGTFARLRTVCSLNKVESRKSAQIAR